MRPAAVEGSTPEQGGKKLVDRVDIPSVPFGLVLPVAVKQ